MITISNNGMITIHRGDTAKFPLFINRGTKVHPVRYELKNHPEAKIYLGVMEPNKAFEKSLIRKSYDYNSPMTKEGDIIVKFSEQDTIMLKPGKYYYEVKLYVQDGDTDYTDTVISKTEFFVVE